MTTPGADPLRVVVVDDEAPARERLRTLLAKDDDVTLVAECDGGRAAIAAIAAHAPDLVFLDIQMPEVDGFDVIEMVGPEQMPRVIFVTAFDQHTLRAFKVNALHYLLKPFALSDFAEAIARARAALRRGDSRPGVALGQMMDARQSLPLDHVLVKDGERIHVVRVSEIDWMKVGRNYVDLHVGKQVHLLRSTLNGLEARLDAKAFVRIHRDTIVRADRVRGFDPWPGGQYRIVLVDGTEHPIGRTYLPRVEERFGKL